MKNARMVWGDKPVCDNMRPHFAGLLWQKETCDCLNLREWSVACNKKRFRFILSMIPTQVSWGCAFSFEKKYTLKEKKSFLVQVSLYLKECSQNIQNPNKLPGTKRIQNIIYITTHQLIHRSHSLSSMSLPGISDSNEQSLNCNFISQENFSCIALSKSVTELLCLMIRSNSFNPSPALYYVLPNALNGTSKRREPPALITVMIYFSWRCSIYICILSSDSSRSNSFISSLSDTPLADCSGQGNFLLNTSNKSYRI